MIRQLQLITTETRELPVAMTCMMNWWRCGALVYWCRCWCTHGNTAADVARWMRKPNRLNLPRAADLMYLKPLGE